MALHPEFPRSPYEALNPDHRWFPAAEELRATAYEKLVPPLIARIREGNWPLRARAAIRVPRPPRARMGHLCSPSASSNL